MFTAYSKGDVVRHNASAWVAKTDLEGCPIYILLGTNPCPPTVVAARTPGNASADDSWALVVQDGSAGAAGPAGISGLEYVDEPTHDVAAGQAVTWMATCPAGKKVIGGGYSGDGLEVQRSYPFSDTQWAVRVVNLQAGTNFLKVWAVCANVS
jgi:hypothetical protein